MNKIKKGKRDQNKKECPNLGARRDLRGDPEEDLKKDPNGDLGEENIDILNTTLLIY